eukprot:s246_g28.t1
MHVPRRRGVASACAACLLFLSALAPVTCEVAENSGAQDDIDELDLGSLDSDDDEEDDVGESAEPVDFDQDMPEELRLIRMQVCLAGATARMQSNAEAVSGLAAQLVDQRPGMSMEQATNSVFFTWMMTCYMNINDEDAKSAGEGNAEVLKDINLYEPSAENQHTAQSASKRQWDFLVQVVKEHMGKIDAARKAQDRKGQSEPQGSGQRPQVQEPPAPASGSKASILLLVVVFGIIGVVTMFLMRKEKEDREEKERKKSSKKDKKKSH